MARHLTKQRFFQLLQWQGGGIRLSLCILCAFSSLQSAASQATPAPTPACQGRNISQCCARMTIEANEACMEYAALGFNRNSCLGWVVKVQEYCASTCANCTAMAKSLREDCRFALAVLSNKDLITNYCTLTMDAIANFRCPAACEVNETHCASPEGRACLENCSLYGGQKVSDPPDTPPGCMCRELRTTGQPTTCTGETFLTGPIPGRMGMDYSCGQTPPKCYHHVNSACGNYKYCEPDMCLIKDVKCVPPDQCLDEGMCEPSAGLCYFNNRPIGYPCDDGVFYTLGDVCREGLCVGVPDYCLKYNVTCTPLSQCTTGGVCHTHSGRCTYTKVHDGTPCDDGRMFTIEDRCYGGLCVGVAKDLCHERGVVCSVPNSCYNPGVCDPLTGLCGDAVAASGYRPCNDGDPTTRNDTCVDGVCLGILADQGENSKFLTLGTGECTDRDGQSMARYAGDVFDEAECRQVCIDDVQCAAYSYAFPLCNIYGTVRTRAPPGRAWVFLEAGTTPVAVAIEKATLSTSGQRAAICRRKGFAGDQVKDYHSPDVKLDDALGFWTLTCFFSGVLLVFLLFPCLQCCFRRGTPVEDARGSTSDYGSKDPHAAFHAYTQDELRTAGDGDDVVPPALPDVPDPPLDPPSYDAVKQARVDLRNKIKQEKAVVMEEEPEGTKVTSPYAGAKGSVDTSVTTMAQGGMMSPSLLSAAKVASDW